MYMAQFIAQPACIMSVSVNCERHATITTQLTEILNILNKYEFFKIENFHLDVSHQYGARACCTGRVNMQLRCILYNATY